MTKTIKTAEGLAARFISVGFLYPDKAWRERFGSLLAGGPEEIKNLFERTSLSDLEEEHVRLFGSSGSVPYDITIYLSRDPFEQAKKMADMAGFYKAFGVDVKEGTRADSLPASFELLSYLWLKVINAREKGWKEKEKITRDAIGALDREFLRPALERFTERLRKYTGAGAGNEFYLELGKFALKSVQEEAA